LLHEPRRSEEPYPQLTLDSIVEADPEVIIVAHSDTTPESIKARPGWEEISAVKNDRVYAVDPDLLNRPGPRLVEGLEKLAELIHPGIFPQG
jgi:iron complex transport system substrate-binding protein